MPAIAEVVTTAPTRHPQGYVRAMFAGTLHWECPECATLNHARVKGYQRKVQCSESSCRKRYIFGIVLYDCPIGSQIAEGIPPDAVLGGQLSKRNLPVNRVVGWPALSEIAPATSVYAP